MPKVKNSFSFGPALCWASALLVMAVCFGIVAYLVIHGIKAVNLSFLLLDPQPSMDQTLSGGIKTPIVGTMLLTAIGILIAGPWAVATAIYLAEYAPDNRVIGLLRSGIDVLAGVPTIIYAIFGLAIFTLPGTGFLSTYAEGVENASPLGRSFFVAGITMAIMVLPFIIKSAEEAIRAVPDSYREAALSLGATKWRSIKRVVLPAARPGIITGIILGIGRIAGDTAIVWLTLGGSMNMTGEQPWWQPQHWLSTLKNTGSTLTTYIYFSSPAGEGNSALKAFGASVILIIFILATNFLVDFISRKTSKEVSQ